MASLKLQGEVTLSSNDKKCQHCSGFAEAVFIADWCGSTVWEGCTNCLIDKLDRLDQERKEVQRKLDEVLANKNMPCICDPKIWGCLCGASAREKFVKKLDALA